MDTPSALPDRADSPRSGSWRLIAPLVLVTGFAMYGQIGTGIEHYTSVTTPWPLKLAVGIGAAVALESIALYVQWHAHNALLLKATATAARLRRASYLLALAVATINYQHFADDWVPTAGAVVFAAFSASGPWLWGLHTRRAQRLQLLREGQVDSTGAVFSAERWRAFPMRTWRARRFSIDYGIDDPRLAWERYRVELERRAAEAESASLPTDEEPEIVELDLLDDLGPFDWWRGAPPADQLRDEPVDNEPAGPDYRDESLPLEERIDLAIAAELAAGAKEAPGRRRLAQLLGMDNDYPIRAVLEARARNGHRQEITS